MLTIYSLITNLAHVSTKLQAKKTGLKLPTDPPRPVPRSPLQVTVTPPRERNIKRAEAEKAFAEWWLAKEGKYPPGLKGLTELSKVVSNAEFELEAAKDAYERAQVAHDRYVSMERAWLAAHGLLE